MNSLTAFKKLEPRVRQSMIARIIERKARFLALTRNGEHTRSVLIVGDKPAPSAPTDPAFHYTPFGAVWHSSLWINLQLINGDIDESKLTWINAASLSDVRTAHAVLHFDWVAVVCLGAAAKKWVDGAGQEFAYPIYQVHHPASWKRFNSKIEYPLIPLLKELTS